MNCLSMKTFMTHIIKKHTYTRYMIKFTFCTIEKDT